MMDGQQRPYLLGALVVEQRSAQAADYSFAGVRKRDCISPYRWTAPIQRIAYYGDAVPEEAGKMMSIEFQLGGQDFLTIDSDVEFPFFPAVSLVGNCQDQPEIDELWLKLADDPTFCVT